MMASSDSAKSAAQKLLAYCEARNWAGHDPYDALNSRLFEVLPFLDAKWPRLILTQALKRSPVDIRGLALIPKTQNSKALALFARAILKLRTLEPAERNRLLEALLERLVALRSPNVPYWCWGYSFAWQTRTIVVPRGAPNLVCTTFVAGALLDLYEERHDPRLLAMAASAAHYILDELYWSEGESLASFSYPLRSLRSQTHNANFLAAALLCRVYRHTGEERLVAPALTVARCSVAKQEADGSWYYGEGSSQRWIDNFHTGYNLCALQSIARDLDTTEFDASIERGYEFYRAHFFREDGAPKYFHNQPYPIDIHCVAQSLITLVAFRDLDPGGLAQAQAVFDWAMRHMWDSRGFFYYRVLRSCTIRTSYMRWSQAWMLLALATLLDGQTASTARPAVSLALASA
jgi:hypothetical protein